MSADTFAHQFLDILKRKDVQNEFNILITPLVSFIKREISPYVYASAAMVFMIFVMITAILIILVLYMLRNK